MEKLLELFGQTENIKDYIFGDDDGGREHGHHGQSEVVDFAVRYRSKEGKYHPGEDAYTISPMPGQRLLIAVADGVGSWANFNVDPALFSNGLIQLIDAKARSGESTMKILPKAFKDLLKKEDRTVGSSTVCLAVIHPFRCIEVINLGDSKLIVVRKGKVVFCTKDQLFSWNYPYQMTIDFEGHNDMSGKADHYKYALIPGDVVILGSDGLFDNLYDREIIKEVVAVETEVKPTGECTQMAAEKIANRLISCAVAASKHKTRSTPFGDKIREYRPVSMGPCCGGKIDDITLIVCCIK